MSLPDISPTGSMTSDEYVDYMIGYLDNALSSVQDDASDYIADQTTTDWYARWEDILDDIDSDITTLNSDILKIKSQIIMIKNIIESKKT
jgi:hypothetical protein